VHFFPDIYGHDKVLDDAMRQRPVAPQSSNTGTTGAKSNN
jgi:hypothetical protein